jgi:hypothetical protein
MRAAVRVLLGLFLLLWSGSIIVLMQGGIDQAQMFALLVMNVAMLLVGLIIVPAFGRG